MSKKQQNIDNMSELFKDFHLEGSSGTSGLFDGLGLTAEKQNERKIYSRVRKQNFKYSAKMAKDIETIMELVERIAEDEEMDIISNVFNSPSIILSYLDRIEELYIATWSITPSGINALLEVKKTGIAKHCIVMVDRTHSYKWIYKSGAAEMLAPEIQWKFAVNHSKFIVMKLTDGTSMNFIGSMNLSNNPRFENIRITRSAEQFEFFKSFVVNA